MKHRFAKKLRKEQSMVEAALWKRLRNRQLGFKFRRQQPLGPYVVDFVCFEKKLIIELDGEQHEDQADYDLRRQDWLESQGYRCLRFWARGFFEELEKHLEGLHDFLHEPE